MRLDLSTNFDDEMSFDGDPAESFRDVGDYSEERDEELVEETIASDPVPSRPPLRVPYIAVPAAAVATESVVVEDPIKAAPREPVQKDRRKISPVAAKVAATKRVADPKVIPVTKAAATRGKVIARKVAVKRSVKVAVPAGKASAKKAPAATPKGKKSSGRKK